MHKLTCAMLLLAPLAMVGNVQAQNAAADRLAQFAQSDPQRRNAIAIGVLCFAGNRLSARLQDDCNNLVGNAFGADPGTDINVRRALAAITADNATVPIDRSGLGKLGLTPSAHTQGSPGWAAQLSADQSMVTLNIADDDSLASNWSLFMNARVNNDQHDRGRNVDGFDRDGSAMTVGFDLRTSSTTHAGAAVVYGKNKLDYSTGSGRLDGTDLGFNLFAGWQGSNGLYLDSLLSYTRRDQDQVRHIAYGLGANSVNQSFDAQFSGDERLLALTVGFQIARGAASFDPYARVEFVDAHSDGYAEVSRNPTGPGGGWAVQSAPLDETFTRGVLGIRAAYAISASNGVYLPFADLSWISVSGADANPARVRYLGDRSVAVNLTPVEFLLPADAEDDNYASAALGISAQWANGWSGFVSYRQQLALDRYQRREVDLGLRMAF